MLTKRKTVSPLSHNELAACNGSEYFELNCGAQTRNAECVIVVVRLRRPDKTNVGLVAPIKRHKTFTNKKPTLKV